MKLLTSLSKQTEWMFDHQHQGSNTTLTLMGNAIYCFKFSLNLGWIKYVKGKNKIYSPWASRYLPHGYALTRPNPSILLTCRKMRLTRLWPRYFLTWPEEIFLIRRGKNWKFGIFRGNFQNPDPKQKMADLTQPEQLKNWCDPITT